MIWRTWGSDSASSARSAYSTRAVGFCGPTDTTPSAADASASSRISRRPRASLVAVPRDGIRSPRMSREIVEWSTPDCWASWRCDIFLALSWARSHSLNARPFSVVIVALAWASAVTPRDLKRSVDGVVRAPNHPLVLAPVSVRRHMRCGRGRWRSVQA